MIASHSKTQTALLVAMAMALVPSSASAHLVSSGVGPFYDGIAHFFVSAEDLLVVVALALFAGLSGPVAAKRLVIALPLAWLIGTALGHRLLVPAVPSYVIPLGTLLVGLLVAIKPKAPSLLPAIFATGLGLLHGGQNGRAMAATETPFLAAFGIISGIALLGLLLASLCSSLRDGWQTITARVLGSWTAAISLLSLAWQLRPDV